VQLDVEGPYIQICGLTSEYDALFAVALGATAVSFDFGPTPWSVSPTLVRDIVRRLPPGVVSIGVFHSEMPERVVEIANSLGLSAVQLNGAMSSAAQVYVAQRVRTVIRAVSTPDEAYAHDGDASLDYLLAPDGEFPSPADDWDAFFGDPLLFRPVIAGGLTAVSVGRYVSSFKVFGVAALSSVEKSPGVKDGVKMGEFIANARQSWDDRRAV
jgi:phosphoribosylanthranilate isomerase